MQPPVGHQTLLYDCAPQLIMLSYCDRLQLLALAHVRVCVGTDSTAVWLFNSQAHEHAAMISILYYQSDSIVLGGQPCPLLLHRAFAADKIQICSKKAYTWACGHGKGL